MISFTWRYGIVFFIYRDQSGIYVLDRGSMGGSNVLKLERIACGFVEKIMHE